MCLHAVDQQDCHCFVSLEAFSLIQNWFTEGTRRLLWRQVGALYLLFDRTWREESHLRFALLSAVHTVQCQFANRTGR